MLQNVKRHPTDATALIMTGSPSELAFFSEGAGTTEDYSVFLGGLVVSGVNRGAKHDGRPAIGFTLTDEMGSRPMGRLVLVDTEAWHEELPEWEVTYLSEEEAQENFLIFRNRPKLPSGWREMKARQIERGMEITDPNTYPACEPVTKIRLEAVEDDGPFAAFKSGIAVFTDAFADPFDSEDVVWVKG